MDVLVQSICYLAGMEVLVLSLCYLAGMEVLVLSLCSLAEMDVRVLVPVFRQLVRSSAVRSRVGRLYLVHSYVLCSQFFM